MGSQNGGIIIQKNNGFTEQSYYNMEKTMGSQNRGIIIQKKQWVHRIEVL